MNLSVLCAQPDVNMFSIMFVHFYDFHPNVSILHIIIFPFPGYFNNASIIISFVCKHLSPSISYDVKSCLANRWLKLISYQLLTECSTIRLCHRKLPPELKHESET